MNHPHRTKISKSLCSKDCSDKWVTREWNVEHFLASSTGYRIKNLKTFTYNFFKKGNEEERKNLFIMISNLKKKKSYIWWILYMVLLENQESKSKILSFMYFWSTVYILVILLQLSLTENKQLELYIQNFKNLFILCNDIKAELLTLLNQATLPVAVADVRIYLSYLKNVPTFAIASVSLFPFCLNNLNENVFAMTSNTDLQIFH